MTPLTPLGRMLKLVSSSQEKAYTRMQYIVAERFKNRTLRELAREAGITPAAIATVEHRACRWVFRRSWQPGDIKKLYQLWLNLPDPPEKP